MGTIVNIKKCLVVLPTLLASFLSAPLWVYAQFDESGFITAYSGSGTNLGPIKQLVASIGTVVNLLIPIAIAVALVVFFWGLIKYIWGSGKGHDQGKRVMIAGLVSLFVMVSVWGIIRLAQGALLSGNQTGSIQIPRFPGQ